MAHRKLQSITSQFFQTAYANIMVEVGKESSNPLRMKVDDLLTKTRNLDVITNIIGDGDHETT